MRSESQIKQALGIWNYPYDALEEAAEDLKSRVRIRKMMKAEPTITLKGIAELLGVTSRTIEITVAQMINGGDIIHEGSKKGGDKLSPPFTDQPMKTKSLNLVLWVFCDIGFVFGLTTTGRKTLLPYFN